MSMSSTMRLSSIPSRSARASISRVAVKPRLVTVVRAQASADKESKKNLGASVAAMVMALALPCCQVQEAVAASIDLSAGNGALQQGKTEVERPKLGDVLPSLPSLQSNPLEGAVKALQGKTDDAKDAAGRFGSQIGQGNPADSLKQGAEQVKGKVSSDIDTAKGAASRFGSQIGQGNPADTLKQGAEQVKGKVSSDIDTAKGAASRFGAQIGQGNPAAGLENNANQLKNQVQGKVSKDIDTAKSGSNSLGDKVEEAKNAFSSLFGK